jgi:hypothetical protein
MKNNSAILLFLCLILSVTGISHKRFLGFVNEEDELFLSFSLQIPDHHPFNSEQALYQYDYANMNVDLYLVAPRIALSLHKERWIHSLTLHYFRGKAEYFEHSNWKETMAGTTLT